MLDPESKEIIYASDGCGDDDNISKYLFKEDGNEDNNLETRLRRRKGKIISCAKETIEHASRQIRRKIPYAGHLMTPRRLWLNKIPTLCDVVIEFSGDASNETIAWLLSRIRSHPPKGLGLQATVKVHESSKRTAFYITAPLNVLYKAAEEVRLPKRLRDDLGGSFQEFTSRECHCFAQIKNEDNSYTLFTSQERQWLVLQILQGMRASYDDMDAMQDKGAIVEEGQSIALAWQENGIIKQIFPLHETSTLTVLKKNWVRKVFSVQPIDEIAEYFGVKVALYFAWLGHYTCALGVPAIFGVILWATLYNRSQVAQDIGHVLFCIFNVAWASLYLEAWRRYSAELAFRWGTFSTPPELLEPPRPLYKGPLVKNSVTGRLEPKESPAWKRHAFRYLVSIPVIGLCLALVFAVMFVMLQLQDWTDQKLPTNGIFNFLSVIPKILLAGAITLMDEAYFKLAVWLNDKENYRFQSKYENHLIAKVALFQFVNSFLSLFYIAFYLRDQDKLKEQLAGLLISRQIIGNLRESAFPYFIEQLNLAKISFSMWGAMSPTQETAPSISIKNKEKKDSTKIPKRSLGQAEIESSYYKYDGTFSDHLEMLVQMGYVVLFSAAFPLAGVCALANNLLEIRSDAFKLAHVHQRPFGQRVANIGTWQHALGFLSLTAIIVNCALIGLSGQVARLWPGLTTTQTVILIVALEHVMLALRSALTMILPELPSWLAAEIARAEHSCRERHCKGSSPHPSPPSPSSPPSTISGASQTNDEIYCENDCCNPLFDTINFSPKLKKQNDEIKPEPIETKFDFSNPAANNKEITRDFSHLQMKVKPFDLPNLGASMHNLPFEIPPFSGPTSSSQQIKILEMPPYRKTHLNQSISDAVNRYASRIPEIPPFKPRASNEWQPTIINCSSPVVHRSVDCIVETKDRINIPSSAPLKPAPSFVNIKQKTESTSSSNKVVGKTPIDEDTKAAAELAEKKSRVKKSLIKRARSVAIFSLKLKERRAREAEKQAANLAEIDKVINPGVPGGELDMLGIEQLIQIDDVHQN